MQPRYIQQSGTGSSDWQILNWNISPFVVGISVAAVGANYTVQYTYDDPSGTYRNPANGTTVSVFNISALSNGTTTLDSNIVVPVAAIRITKNSGTGYAVMTFIQGGVAGN